MGGADVAGARSGASSSGPPASVPRTKGEAELFPMSGARGSKGRVTIAEKMPGSIPMPDINRRVAERRVCAIVPGDIVPALAWPFPCRSTPRDSVFRPRMR